MEIKTIANMYVDELDEAVNAALAEGWRLRGCVTFASDYVFATLERYDGDYCPRHNDKCVGNSCAFRRSDYFTCISSDESSMSYILCPFSGRQCVGKCCAMWNIDEEHCGMVF